MISFQDRLDATANHPRGFDYLRLVLAVSVVAFHGILVCYGEHTEKSFWTGPLHPLVFFIVPSFFALSGFLVAGSLERNTISQFLSLRVIRIFPALAVETLISALVLGPLLTATPLRQYFSDIGFFKYFLNIMGKIHYTLPGVFDGLPDSNIVNIQLWTVPIELVCYIAITLLALLGIAKRPAWLLTVACVGVLLSVLLQHLGLWDIHFDTIPPRRFMLLSFLFGASFFGLRKNIPYSFLLSLVSVISYSVLVSKPETQILSSLPLVYVTVFVGLLNPPWTPLIVAADYSYGIYLYGFPLQQSVSYVLPSYRIWIVNVLLGGVLALGCAFLSWTFVESKVLSKKKQILSFVTAISERIPVHFANIGRVFSPAEACVALLSRMPSRRLPSVLTVGTFRKDTAPCDDTRQSERRAP